MKKTLALLLLMPVICFSQKKDSLAFFEPIGTQIETERVLYYPYTPRQDTIAVMLLVCDTSFTTLSSTLDVYEIADSLKRIYEVKNRVPYVWWQFGYEVVRYKEENNGEQTWNIQELVGYLDQNKKPLSKSIVVWLSKEIK